MIESFSEFLVWDVVFGIVECIKHMSRPSGLVFVGLVFYSLVSVVLPVS